jgi:hypothetical protein
MGRTEDFIAAHVDLAFDDMAGGIAHDPDCAELLSACGNGEGAGERQHGCDSHAIHKATSCLLFLSI